MDYFDILKKALKISWKYKALWVLGFFAGAGGGMGGSYGGSNSGWRTGAGEVDTIGTDIANWYADNVTLVLVLIGVLLLVGFIFFILSIAAQGGLAHATNAASEDRKASLGESWGVGFRMWGRTFMIGFVLSLPALVLGLAVAGIGIAAIVGGAAVGSEGGIVAALGGMCLVIPLFVVVMIAWSFVIGVLQPLALRYGVLQDVTFGDAIKRAWSDLWGKRGAVVFLLVMILPGMVYGFATLLIMLPFGVAAVALVIAESYLAAVAVGVLMVVALMVPGAFYSTFHYAAWTVFFRRMTGAEEQPAQAVAAPSTLPAPPAPPAPSADVAPEGEAPPSDV